METATAAPINTPVHCIIMKWEQKSKTIHFVCETNIMDY